MFYEDTYLLGFGLSHSLSSETNKQINKNKNAQVLKGYSMLIYMLLFIFIPC